MLGPGHTALYLMKSRRVQGRIMFRVRSTEEYAPQNSHVLVLVSPWEF